MVMAWPVPAIAMLVLAKSNPAATRGVPRPKLSSAAANSAQGRGSMADAMAGSIADAMPGSVADDSAKSSE